jgi:hypothetical protein
MGQWIAGVDQSAPLVLHSIIVRSGPEINFSKWPYGDEVSGKSRRLQLGLRRRIHAVQPLAVPATDCEIDRLETSVLGISLPTPRCTVSRKLVLRTAWGCRSAFSGFGFSLEINERCEAVPFLGNTAEKTEHGPKVPIEPRRSLCI